MITENSVDSDIIAVIKGIKNGELNADKNILKEKKTSSAVLSLSAYIEYLQDKKNYLKALNTLKEAGYIADIDKDIYSKTLYEYVFAKILKSEKNDKESLIHFRIAERMAYEKDIFGILFDITEEIRTLEEKSDDMLKKGSLVALLKIGHEIAAETDIDVLLRVIAQETRIAIKADRCTVFLYDKEKDELWSKIALGLDSQEIRFSASKGLAGHVVKTGNTINIRDAYQDPRFNPEIDKQTGYRTKTILCMPIKNHNQEIIGAFQVLNKFDGVFTQDDEDLLVAIGSSAGISIVNAQLFQRQQQMLEEQKQIFDSFIDTLATSIDAKDSITAGHSSRVRMYSGLIASKLSLEPRMKRIIETAATLHDIGKIGIRDSVLQKEGKLTDEEYSHIQKHVEITYNILHKIHMSEDFKLVTDIACSHHEKYNGMGYYRKISGQNIPLGGRILAISDVFDAITSKRHYRDKMPILNVLKIFVTDNNQHFDKGLVDMFLSVSTDKIVEVFLTENHLELTNENRRILERYTLKDLYTILNKEIKSDDEKRFVDLFEHYYIARTNEEE